jgi:DNA-3-methyladenine glycosylase
LVGLDSFSQNRYRKLYHTLTSLQKKQLANGPGKVCLSMKITRKQNGVGLFDSSLYVEEGPPFSFLIQPSKRIGIDYAKEAMEHLWRFSAIY